SERLGTAGGGFRGHKGTKECSRTNGRVGFTGSVPDERFGTNGRVLGGGVEAERVRTDGRVVAANVVVDERERTNGRVILSDAIRTEGLASIGCVVVAHG